MSVNCEYSEAIDWVVKEQHNDIPLSPSEMACLLFSNDSNFIPTNLPNLHRVLPSGMTRNGSLTGNNSIRKEEVLITWCIPEVRWQ